MFMSPTFLVVITIGFFIIQWMALRSFPKPILGLVAYYPLLGFLANLAVSGSISIFTGVASFVGIANMLSSIIVAFWLMGYKKYHGVDLIWGKYMILKPIIWFKYPKFIERRSEEHWFF